MIWIQGQRPSLLAWRCATFGLAAVLIGCGGGEADDKKRVDPLLTTEQLRTAVRTERIDCPTYVTTDLAGQGFECWSSDAPEDYRAALGKRIKVMNLVHRTTAAHPKGIVYVLDGGPGGSGLQYVKNRLYEPFNDDGWDVVIPAHRGTQSSYIPCPQVDAAQAYLADPANECTTTTVDPVTGKVAIQKNLDRPVCNAKSALTAPGSCNAEFAVLRGGGAKGALAASQYNTVNAARDVVASTKAIQRGPVSVALGVSYGTYWAQRIAQLHPTAFDKIVLDSPVPLNRKLADSERYLQGQLEYILDQCLQDSTCSRQLGNNKYKYPSGKDMAAAAVASINQQKCGPAGDPSVVIKDEDIPPGDTAARSPWRVGLMPEILERWSIPEAWPVLPYIINLAISCGTTELEMFAHANPQLGAGVTDGSHGFARYALDASGSPLQSQPMVIPREQLELDPVLYDAVLPSEFYDARSPETEKALIDVVDSVTDRAIGPDRAATSYLSRLKQWAEYVFEGTSKSYDSITSQILVMGARVDPATPWGSAQAMLADMRASGLQPEYYGVVHATHAVVRTSPIASGSTTCSVSRALHFINNGAASAFTCADTPVDWSFKGEGARSSCAALGRTNPWASPTDADKAGCDAVNGVVGSYPVSVD